MLTVSENHHIYHRQGGPCGFPPICLPSTAAWSGRGNTGWHRRPLPTQALPTAAASADRTLAQEPDSPCSQGGPPPSKGGGSRWWGLLGVRGQLPPGSLCHPGLPGWELQQPPGTEPAPLVSAPEAPASCVSLALWGEPSAVSRSLFPLRQPSRSPQQDSVFFPARWEGGWGESNRPMPFLCQEAP